MRLNERLGWMCENCKGRRNRLASVLCFCPIASPAIANNQPSSRNTLVILDLPHRAPANIFHPANPSDRLGTFAACASANTGTSGSLIYSKTLRYSGYP
jgi:hypothetical protein